MLADILETTSQELLAVFNRYDPQGHQYASIISAQKYPLLNSPEFFFIDLVASIKMDYIFCFTYLKKIIIKKWTFSLKIDRI